MRWSSHRRAADQSGVRRCKVQPRGFVSQLGVSLKGMSDKRYDSDKKSAAKATLNSKDDAVYKEKFKQALPYLEESAQVRTEDAALWTQLGRLYAILNMPDKSKTAFERADKSSRASDPR